jgi:hypothetical protein
MIKLLGFLFAVTCIHGSEQLFHFPDHHSRSSHFLEEALKKSSSVLIITHSFSHTKLSKAIVSASHKGSHIRFILNDRSKEPIGLIQYQNIDLSLTPLPLSQSHFLIDNTLLCTTDIPINEEMFSSTHATMRCTRESKKIQPLLQWITHIQNNSEPYLK